MLTREYKEYLKELLSSSDSRKSLEYILIHKSIWQKWLSLQELGAQLGAIAATYTI
jgi:hypothetical protein